jgi:hypothetical protein
MPGVCTCRRTMFEQVARTQSSAPGEWDTPRPAIAEHISILVRRSLEFLHHSLGMQHLHTRSTRPSCQVNSFHTATHERHTRLHSIGVAQFTWKSSLRMECPADSERYLVRSCSRSPFISLLTNSTYQTYTKSLRTSSCYKTLPITNNMGGCGSCSNPNCTCADGSCNCPVRIHLDVTISDMADVHLQK